jgi:long-subunit acyl-CoA synthetase (AMP-forming)
MHRAGSVGKPLPGIDISISRDGEILVAHQAMSGYLGDLSVPQDVIHTGDLGHLDQDGFLYVTGRKKDVFITSFGRNVSPEWPESELLHQPEIAQASVFGEAQPVNTAVIVPSGGAQSERAIADAVCRANSKLPDYAQVSDWIIASEPFTVANQLMTATGKVKREAVKTRFIIGTVPAARPGARTLPHERTAGSL